MRTSCATGSSARARGPGGGARCADLCRQPRESRRARARSPLCVRARRHLRRRRGARAARDNIGSIRSCTSPRNRTSIARSWDPTISSAPMWSVRMRCSRQPRRCGWSARSCPRIAFIMCPRTRCTARLGPTMRRFTNRRPMPRIRRTPRARRPRITWCARTTRPMGSHTTVTNCSNNYGPYQFPEKLIPLTIINILMGKRPAGVRRWAAGARLAARRPTIARR